jgi:ubiquitin carboxyl-terminal hydrolase 34
MRPYTVEHLNNSSEERPPDIFELVGVLVHAGTAESGHYYSYIRERPTTSDSEVWVEFNDETVSPWDQGQMETACFGGPDYRTPYDNSGVVYDKTYSAYMLFYQRSSTVKKEQALLRQSGVLSPLHVPLSQDIGQYIQRENLSLLRRHCIYDPTHIHFVHMTLYQLKAMNNDGCTESHELEDKAIRMALSHLDQVASRAKDAPDFDQLLKRLAIHSQSCPRCSLAIYNYFNQNSEAMRMLVQRNAEQAVRKGTSDLLIQALHVIKLHLPQTYGIPLDDSDELTSDSLVIHGVIRMFNVLFDFFHLSIRSWHEVFGLMLSFVQMGPHEKAAFLEHPFLRFLILLISADLNMEMPQQFARMIATVSRRLPNRPPSYDNIIGLLNELLSSMHIPFDENGDAFVVDHLYQRLRVSDGVEGPYVFTRVESRLLHQDWSRGQANIFVDKLIGIHQNHPATYSILANLIRCSRLMEDKIFRTLRLAIGGHVTAHLNSPYLQVASQVYCRFGTQPVAIDKLVAHINQQCMCLQNTEGRAFLEFQRDVFDTPREKSGESREEVLLMGLENLADWVPGLLGYFDSVVTGEVELFLHEKLFRFGSSPDFGDTIDGMKRAEVMVNSARSLGTQCLVFLRDTYVNQRMSVSTQLVVTFERVIKECRNYFDLNEPIEDSMTADFVKLAQSK